MKVQVIFEYCFDIGGDIKLEKLKEKAHKLKKFATSEKILGPKYVTAGLSSALFDLGTIKVGKDLFKANGELYEMGELIISFSKQISLQAIKKQRNSLESEILIEKAKSLSKELISDIKEYITLPYEYPEVIQPYFIVLIKGKPKINEKWNTQILRNIGNPSDQEIFHCNRLKIKYGKDDLSVIDHTGIISYDAHGNFQPIIENVNVALAQLVALKTYDFILDKRLAKIYDDVKRLNEKKYLGFNNPVKSTIREIVEIKTDINDRIEDVVQLTKITGNWYLARVYSAASERFKLDHWLENIRRKMRDLQDFHEMLSHRTTEKKMETLTVLMTIAEVIIVLLIIIELIIAL